MRPSSRWMPIRTKPNSSPTRVSSRSTFAAYVRNAQRVQGGGGRARGQGGQPGSSAGQRSPRLWLHGDLRAYLGGPRVVLGKRQARASRRCDGMRLDRPAGHRRLVRSCFRYADLDPTGPGIFQLRARFPTSVAPGRVGQSDFDDVAVPYRLLAGGGCNLDPCPGVPLGDDGAGRRASPSADTYAYTWPCRTHWAVCRWFVGGDPDPVKPGTYQAGARRSDRGSGDAARCGYGWDGPPDLPEWTFTFARCCKRACDPDDHWPCGTGAASPPLLDRMRGADAPLHWVVSGAGEP